MTIWIRNVSRTSLAAIALAGMMSTVASAATINFNQGNGISPGGTVSYNGNGGPVFGNGIVFDRISLEHAAAPSGHENNLFCQGCALNFATGFNTSEGPKTWTFNSLGGSFTLTGNVFEEDAQGNPTGNSIAQGALAAGIFTGTQTAIETGPSQSTLKFDGGGVDQKPTSLLQYFGLNAVSPFSFSSSITSSGANFGDNGSFSGAVTGADVSNVAVPEPSELGLFGLGMLFMGVYASWRCKGGLSNST